MRWLGCLLIVTLLLGSTFAQEGAGGARSKERDKKPRPFEKAGTPRKGAAALPLPPFTPQVEGAALAFAKEHFPKLADLLEHLKAHSKDDYQRAIGELYRTSERLAQAKQKDKERYELELLAWKIDSRIRLIVARMSMEGPNSSLKEELRQQLIEKHDVQLQRLLLERQRAERRIKSLDTEIEKHKAQREKVADKGVDQLVRSAETVKNDKRVKRPRSDAVKRDAAKNVDGGSTEVKIQNRKP